MALRRVVFLPGVMGSALGHRDLRFASVKCSLEAGTRGLIAGPEAAVAVVALTRPVCSEADVMWGRLGMLYSALEGREWYELLSSVRGLDDPGDGFVVDEGDGLTRIDGFCPYDDLVESLRKAGIIDVLVHAYDWRLSNVDNARRLSTAIKTRWEFGSPPRSDERITIIAHSMGGLVARYYLESEELSGATLTRNLVTVGTPHLGAPEMFTHMMGLTQPLDRLPSAIEFLQMFAGVKGKKRGHLLDPELQKLLCFKFASLIEMLPVYDFVVRSRKGKVKWEDTLSCITLPDHGGKTALDLVRRFRQGLVTVEDLPHWLDCVGVHYTLFGASGIRTVTGYDARSDEVLREQTGDGTVPLYSAHMGNSADGKRGSAGRARPRNLVRALIVEKPARKDEYANPKKFTHQDLMRIEAVKRQIVDTSTIRFRPPKLVPDTWLPFLYHYKVVRMAAVNKKQPKGEEARPWGEPIVTAVATLTLRDPMRQPVLRYTSAPCKRTIWNGDCIQGLEGVIPYERDVTLPPIGNRTYFYVELTPAEPARSVRGCGGILILPQKRCDPEVYLGGWNVTSLDTNVVTNAHHAEIQVLAWLERQDEAWRERVETVHLSVTHSPCAFCVHNLVTALTGTEVGHRKTVPLIQPRTAILSWRDLYVNDRLALTTTLEHIKKLKLAGWNLEPISDWRTKLPSS